MEIKIRVWASNDEYPNGRMFYPEDEDNPFMLNMHGDLLTARQKAPHNFDTTYARIGYNGIEIMLYTGLKDKNGKEIYEGDILYYNDEFLKEGVQRERIVEYNNDTSRFKGGKVNDLYQPLLDRPLIIGNIYDGTNT